MNATTPVPTPARLALVDDHAIVRAGYARLIELEDDLVVCAEFGDPDQALTALAGALRGRVDVLVLDLSMPGRSGLDLLRSIVRAGLPLQVLVVSMHDSAALVTQCLQAGARGFVSKSADPQALIDALRRVVRGEPVLPPGHDPASPRPPHHDLTARELEVLRLLLTGMPFEAIAQQLGVSEKTVSNHQTQIRQKLGVANAIELVHCARQHGLMP
ncbi:response regulator transcription factor [Leptothrix discophora]|uniref:Response regulator transcription factor n=1 Tax=Leptothrix discophora TaxID=89 RepID=A0ABT9G7N4_LEPDI|nr:response regulator transcription factor [Leptothrix discophora]MDP4302480.1 response regulator transcription factor [Leptothrix discophora]